MDFIFISSFSLWRWPLQPWSNVYIHRNGWNVYIVSVFVNCTRMWIDPNKWKNKLAKHHSLMMYFGPLKKCFGSKRTMKIAIELGKNLYGEKKNSTETECRMFSNISSDRRKTPNYFSHMNLFWSNSPTMLQRAAT